MARNVLNNVTNLDEADARDVNQYKEALSGTLYPRNNSGVPETEAASVGTPSFQFEEVHAKRFFENGVELSTPSTGGPGTTPTGPGTITAGSTIRNGVVSWLEPAGRRGQCGAIHQSGNSGVTITATTDDPLVVKLDGREYSRTSPVSGGVLPSNFNQAITPVVANSGVSSTYGGTWAGNPRPLNADRAKYRYSLGGDFFYHDPTAAEILPDSYGNNIIIKSSGGVAGTSYTYCERVSDSGSESGQRNKAKLKRAGCFNTSPTAQIYPEWNLPFHTTVTVIRCGALFIDPLSNWNINISARIVGAVNTTLPPTTGLSTGDVVFLESTQRWHRYNGTTWAETSFVLLAYLAIDGGAVEAVMPVQSEANLNALLDKKTAVLGSPISREGVVVGDEIIFGGDTENYEEKGFTAASGQFYDQVGTSARVDTGDTEAGTLVNNSMHAVYLDIYDNKYYFEADSPPVFHLYRGRLLATHANRSRLWVGSFVTDSSGTLIAQQRLHTRTDVQRNFMAEGDDDAWLISNPCLFGRSRMTDLGQPEPRRMQIQIRGQGTRSSGNNTYNYRWRGTHVWWPGPLLTKPLWNELFYDFLPSMIPTEFNYDTDNHAYLKVEFSQFDEESLLRHFDLAEAPASSVSAAASEGAVGAGGEGSIGSDSIAPSSIGPEQLQAINDYAANKVYTAVADPDDSTRILGSWQDQGNAVVVPDNAVTPGKLNSTNSPATDKAVIVDPDNVNRFKFVDQSSGGGGGTPADGSLTFAKFASSAIATEEDVFGEPTQNNKVVGNKILFDAVEQMSTEMDPFYDAWSAIETTERDTIPATGTWDVAGVGTVNLRNSSSFNVRTSALAANTLYLVGTSCSGMPSVLSGTLRGAWLFIDSENTRFVFPITNPEGSDSEAFFRVVGAAYQAVSYNSDLLRTHYRGAPADGNFNAFASHARGGPGFSQFQNNADIGRKGTDGNIVALTSVYDTNTNKFRAFTSKQALSVPVSPGSVNTAAIVNGAITASKMGQNSVTGSAIAPGAVADGNIANRTISGGKIALRAVGLDELDITQSAQNANKLIGINSGANAFQLFDQQSGGTPANNSITHDMLQQGIIDSTNLAANIYASEADVFNASGNNTRVVGNSTLAGVLEDVDNETAWKAWSAVSQLNVTTLAASQELTAGDVTLQVRNSSAFNAGTATLTAGAIYLCGSSCAGLPTLTSGTLRGGLLFIDKENQRFFLTIANPEGPDDEATWIYQSNAWVAHGYRDNALRTSWGSLRPNSTWEAMSSLAIGGPAANQFNDEVAAGQADERKRYAIRVAYSTSTNRYEVVTATSNAVFELQNQEVTVPNLASSNTAAADKYITVDSTDITKVKYVDAPSGGGGGSSEPPVDYETITEFDRTNSGSLYSINWRVGTNSFTTSNFPSGYGSASLTIPDIGALNLDTINTSTFNAGTSTGTYGILGPNCSGLPTLASGSVLAGILVIGDKYRSADANRFFIPLSTTTLADNEKIFKWNGTSWTGMTSAQALEESAVIQSVVTAGKLTLHQGHNYVLSDNASGSPYSTFAATYHPAAASLKNNVLFFKLDRLSSISFSITASAVRFNTPERIIGVKSIIPSSIANQVLGTGTANNVADWKTIGYTETQIANITTWSTGGTNNLNTGESINNYDEIRFEYRIGDLYSSAYYTTANTGSASIHLLTGSFGDGSIIGVDFSPNGTTFSIYNHTQSSSGVNFFRIYGRKLTLS